MDIPHGWADNAIAYSHLAAKELLELFDHHVVQPNLVHLREQEARFSDNDPNQIEEIKPPWGQAPPQYKAVQDGY